MTVEMKVKHIGPGLMVLMMVMAGCGGVTMKLHDTAEEQYRAAMKEYDDGNYLKAIDGLQKMVFNFSGAPTVDSAQYHLGMSQYHLKDYYLAATEFERVVKNYPGSPLVDDALYMTGVCYFRASPGHYGLDQAELVKAINAFEDFVVDYPESDLVDDARDTLRTAYDRLARKRYESGRLYFRLSDYRAAGIYFQSVIDEHTDSEWAASALYYLGEIDYKQKNYEEARAKFKNFLIVYPHHELSGRAVQMLAKLDKYLVGAAKEN